MIAAIPAPRSPNARTLPVEHLGRADRRDPEELDDAARALADERQGDERDRQVLEDQGEDGRREELDDVGLGRRDVVDLGAGRGGDHVGRDGRGLGIAGRDGIALALGRDAGR